jgi:hypothetical protein
MPVSVSEPVKELITAEYSGKVTAQGKENVEISLYHVHLPKVADFNVIDFDAKRGHITEKLQFDDSETWPNWIDAEGFVRKYE